MKSFTQFILFVLALAVIALLGWGGFIFIKYLGSQLNLLDQKGSATIILLTVVLVICAILITRAIKNSLSKFGQGSQPERGEVYKTFVHLWFSNAASDKPMEQWGQEWKILQPQLALWASDKVLKHFQKLIKLAKDSTPGSPDSKKQAETVVLEMRRDMGANNQNWNQEQWGELLSI